MLPEHYLVIGGHLGAAWLAGSLIGFERSYHGRPAGFRTHALVGRCRDLFKAVLLEAAREVPFPRGLCAVLTQFDTDFLLGH